MTKANGEKQKSPEKYKSQWRMIKATGEYIKLFLKDKVEPRHLQILKFHI
jgi:hypothetical protein